MFSSFISTIHFLHDLFRGSKIFWQRAMYKKLEAFRYIHTWDLIPLPPDTNLVSRNGYTKSRSNQMGMSNDTKLVWLLKDFLRNMTLIIKRHLLQ